MRYPHSIQHGANNNYNRHCKVANKNLTNLTVWLTVQPSFVYILREAMNTDIDTDRCQTQLNTNFNCITRKALQINKNANMKAVILCYADQHEHSTSVILKCFGQFQR